MLIKEKHKIQLGIILVLSALLLGGLSVFAGESDNYVSSPEVIDEGGGWTESPQSVARTSIGQSAIGLSDDNNHLLYWGYIWHIHNPPDPPKPVSPEDGDTVYTPFPKLTWKIPLDPESDYLHFIVEVSESSGRGVRVYNSSEDPSSFAPRPPVASYSGLCVFGVPDSLPDGEYSWRVKAFDHTDTSRWSIEWKFIVFSDTANHAPKIVSVPDTTVYVDSVYSYHVIATDDDDDPLSYDVVNLCDTTMTIDDSGYIAWIPEEEDTGLCYVIVYVCDADTCVKQEYGIWVLENPNYPPGIPALVYPLAGSLLNVDTVVFVWTVPTDPNGDGLCFILEIDDDGNFDNGGTAVFNDGFMPACPVTQGEGSCSLMVDMNRFEDGVYHWRVIARDAEDNGEASIANRFYLDLPPDAPTNFAAEACGPEVNLSWTPSSDPDLGAYFIYRGLEIASLSVIDSVPMVVTSIKDTPPILDTMYYYAVAALDTVGHESPLSNVDSAYPFPYHVEGFSSQILGGAQVKLSWTPSFLDSIYYIYYTEGETLTALMDTSGAIYPPDSTWTTPPGLLSMGHTYTFMIRVLTICGYDDNSREIYLTVTLTDTSYYSLCKRVKITIPKPGKKLSGNCVNIKADTDCPAESLLNISCVLFQKYYRGAPDSGWTNITRLSSDSLNHPNPDSTPPYFIHWRVEDEPEGDYLIRAVAFDSLGVRDPDPVAIPVIVEKSRPRCGSYYGPDTSKGVPTGYIYTYWERVYPNIRSSVYVGDFDDTEDWMYLPGSFIEEPDVMTYNMSNGEEDTSYYSIQEFFGIDLQSGIDMVSGPDPIELVLEYPDHDGDSIVDSTEVPEDSLQLYWWDGSEWDTVYCVLDVEKNTITALTYQLGKFSILKMHQTQIAEVERPDAVSMSVHPSPFNSTLAILYRVPYSSNISLEVYDVMGRRVTTVIDSRQDKGLYSVRWQPANNVPSGVYLLKLKAGSEKVIRRAVYLK